MMGYEGQKAMDFMNPGHGPPSSSAQGLRLDTGPGPDVPGAHSQMHQQFPQAGAQPSEPGGCQGYGQIPPTRSMRPGAGSPPTPGSQAWGLPPTGSQAYGGYASVPAP